jgi:uncharacterized protein YndB with AHSA1/START domain
VLQFESFTLKNNIMETKEIIFSVDKEHKRITVEKEFAAPKSEVWAAWTQSNLLDKWWAPKPWKSETKNMDFKEGGNMALRYERSKRRSTMVG